MPFYHRLTKEFLTIFHSKEENLFVQWGNLLAIDAQLQILMEISNNRKEGLLDDLGWVRKKSLKWLKMTIQYFYREITGAKLTQKPKMGLIYLSEHLAESWTFILGAPSCVWELGEKLAINGKRWRAIDYWGSFIDRAFLGIEMKSSNGRNGRFSGGKDPWE